MSQRWARCAEPVAATLAGQLVAGEGPGWEHPSQHPEGWQDDWVVVWHPTALGAASWWAVFAPKRLRARPVPVLPSRPRDAWRLVGSSLPGYSAHDRDPVPWPVACRVTGSPLERATFFLDEVDESSPVLAAVRSGSPPARRHIPPATSWVMRLPESIEAFWSGFGRKTRYNIQRNAKRLGATFHTITAPEQVADFCRHAEQVARRSWQAEALGLRVAATPATITRMERQARAGTVRNYLLTVGETPVAFVLGQLGGGVMYYEEIAYDQDHAKHSPGTVLLTQIIEELITSGTARVLDFGLGDAPYKRQFATDTMTRGSWVIPFASADRALWWAHERGVAMRGAARRLARRLKERDHRSPAPSPAREDEPG